MPLFASSPRTTVYAGKRYWVITLWVRWVIFIVVRRIGTILVRRCCRNESNLIKLKQAAGQYWAFLRGSSAQPCQLTTRIDTNGDVANAQGCRQAPLNGRQRLSTVRADFCRPSAERVDDDALQPAFGEAELVAFQNVTAASLYYAVNIWARSLAFGLAFTRPIKLNHCCCYAFR